MEFLKSLVQKFVTASTIRRVVAFLIGLLCNFLVLKFGFHVPEDVQLAIIGSITSIVGFYILGSNWKEVTVKKADLEIEKTKMAIESNEKAMEITDREKALAELRKGDVQP